MKKLPHTQKATQTKNGAKAAALAQSFSDSFINKIHAINNNIATTLNRVIFRLLDISRSQPDLIQEFAPVNVDEVKRIFSSMQDKSSYGLSTDSHP